jgi:putative flippase GtrA
MMKVLLEKRLMKFLIVGTSGTIIDFILFIACYEFVGWGIIASNIVSYGTGLSSSFFLNRSWTFADSTKRSHRRLVLALTFGYIGLVINTFLVWLLAFVFPVLVGKLIAVLLIVIYNYLTNKHIVFLVK